MAYLLYPDVWNQEIVFQEKDVTKKTKKLVSELGKRFLRKPLEAFILHGTNLNCRTSYKICCIQNGTTESIGEGAKVVDESFRFIDDEQSRLS